MVDPTFNDGYICALADLGTVRSYAKNTVVFQEGDLSDQVYVVVSGKLKVFLADSDGKEVIVDILGARQYFGEMALDGRPRSASVITLEASKLAIVQREQFKRFLSENPEAAFGLIVTLIGRARNLTRAVGSMGLLDVYGRVARLLLDNAVERDGQTGNEIVLAPGLGVAPHAEMGHQGMVLQVQPHRILVIDASESIGRPG